MEIGKFEECKSKLWQYISDIYDQQSETNDQIDVFIGECRLHLLLSELFHNKQKRIMAHARELGQKRVNELLKDEILSLVQCAKKEGMELVILKGVPFSECYYEQPWKRISSDIDVFISGENFKGFIEICRRAGYKLKGEVEIEEKRCDRFATDFFCRPSF